jgi:hypothetical protein
MRKTLLGIAVAALVAGGVFYGWAVQSQHRFRAALDDVLERLPPGYSVTIKTADYSVLDDHVTLRGVVISGGTAQNFDASIDEIEVEKPSRDFLVAWGQAAANPAALAPDFEVSVGHSISARGVTVHAATASVTVASFTLEGLRLYPWALLHPGVPSWAEAQAVLVNRARPPELADLQPLLRFEAAMMLGIGYDRYALENFQATAKLPAVPNFSVTDVTYSLRKVTGGGYDRGNRGDATADDLNVQASPLGALTVDRIAVANLDLREPFSRLLAGGALTPATFDGLAIGRIDYDGMIGRLPTGVPVTLGKLTLSNIAVSGGVPVAGALAYSGLRIRRAQMPNAQSLEIFDKLGLETVTLGLGFSFKWDLEQKRMTLSDIVLKADELGALTLSVDLAGMGGDAAWQSDVKLAHAALRYDDASLMERLLRTGAAQSGVDVAAFRQQIIATIRERISALGDNPAISAAAKALVTFLASPHTVTVELAPPTPVGVGLLQTARDLPPAELVSRLGLSVSAVP